MKRKIAYRRLRGLHEELMVGAPAYLSDDGQIHQCGVPHVRHLCLVFGLMGSAIAVTAFRRGDPWAWWTLLAGNTIALVSAMRYDWMVNAIGPFELTEYLGLAPVYGALAITAPFLADGRLLRRTG